MIARNLITRIAFALLVLAASAPAVQAQQASKSATAASPALAPAQPTPATVPAPTPVAAALLPQDLSPWGMFLSADIVVKIVMVAHVSLLKECWGDARVWLTLVAFERISHGECLLEFELWLLRS